MPRWREWGCRVFELAALEIQIGVAQEQDSVQGDAEIDPEQLKHVRFFRPEAEVNTGLHAIYPAIKPAKAPLKQHVTSVTQLVNWLLHSTPQ